MNLVKSIFRMIAKVVFYWFWVIPIELGIVALLGYFGLIFLISGTIDVDGIKAAMDSYGVGYGLGIVLPFGMPMLLALGATVAPMSSGRQSGNEAIDRALEYRNGQMNIASPKEAAKIYESTAHLDIMKANSGVSVFDKAKAGFNATHGVSSPSEIYKGMTKK